jgi:hypothetical protein
MLISPLVDFAVMNASIAPFNVVDIATWSRHLEARNSRRRDALYTAFGPSDPENTGR